MIEERIGMLATAVSLAPFLGLFGTVWGVMIAFCGVASAGSANIQALAPGVAGALLTTVAGLVVAIPSLVGYNFLTQMIRKITVSMDNFSESFMARLKLEQLTARDPEKNTTAATAATAGTTAHPAAQITNNLLDQQQLRPNGNQASTQMANNFQPRTAFTQSPAPAAQSVNYQYQAPQYQQPPRPAAAQYRPAAVPQSVQYQQMPAASQQEPEQMSFDSMNADNMPEDSMRG